jgi:NAD(P)-dependent dehydrogenase (short-subunit alcohol dehydrogenase family)
MIRRMRLGAKAAIVVGGGQTPGATIGNGRATALVFAREGARVLVVDRDLGSAEETVEMIGREGGQAAAFRADVTDEASVRAAVQECAKRWGRIDVLHNNVGVSLAAGDAPVTEIEVEAFDRVVAINLRGMVLTCKHALPVMRAQRAGVIINISSAAATASHPCVGYKTTKAAVVALTQQLALANARYLVRANAILPGLMNTPMAIEPRLAQSGADAAASREKIVAARDAQVPLGQKMGTGWDVAHAALFLASDEARFITGVALPVDGGLSVRIG